MRNRRTIHAARWPRPARLLCAVGWLAGLCRGADLEIRVEGMRADERVVVQLFDSADSFGRLRDPLRTVRWPGDGRDALILREVPPGDYALSVYFDANGNDRLDRNFIGIPREPVGFSNGYRPKGPPSYGRASFSLSDNAVARHSIRLERPLGQAGRIGIGAGLIARGNPYRDADTPALRFLPAVTYIGDRVQLLGPGARIGLAGAGRIRLAAALTYRFAVYDEEDSPVLAGLGDRKDTLMAGPALTVELPAGLALSIRYEHDALDRIGGGAAQAEGSRSWRWRSLNLTPSLAVAWNGADLSFHDFGVPEERSIAGRPAYSPGDTFSVETGLGISIELSRSVRFFLDAGIEFFDHRVTDSPTVDSPHVVKTVSVLTYVF